MEDYKEKYEMALKKAKKFIEENPLVQNLNTWIKETFPELKESEDKDEEIKKALITLIQSCDKGCYTTISPSRIKEYTAWLEKQGEQIDTLKTKEVDFEKEWEEYFKYRGDVATVNIKHLAKHFFELGIRASNPIHKNLD